jgi:hypothetical protein
VLDRLIYACGVVRKDANVAELDKSWSNVVLKPDKVNVVRSNSNNVLLVVPDKRCILQRFPVKVVGGNSRELRRSYDFWWVVVLSRKK